MIADRLRALVAELRSSHGWIGFTQNDYANRLERILAEDAGGWRSMDSAPRNGAFIELRGSSGPYGITSWIGYAHWMRGENALPPTWRDVAGASLRLAGYRPEQWRPSPPPQEPQP